MIRVALLFCVAAFLNLSSSVLSTELYETPNVKTSLFTELDLRRSCWNHEEINMLRARMIMQDLIPKKVPRDMAYVAEYVRSTEEAVVQHSPEGKVRRIMMMALSDVMGGYLQAVAVPMAKEAYYAGNTDYATMSRLYELLKEMRSRLRTDGGRWSRPVDMSKFAVKVTELHLPMENSELACKAMFVTPVENCLPGLSRIAIPYLDYDLKPGAVALPLKSRNLYSLKTAASGHIIVRFYILARQCLSEMPPSDTQLFNYQFVKWLMNKVVPHLYEDTWYPGFGSVMRIVETVNETEILNLMKQPFFAASDITLEKSLIHGKTCGIVEKVKIMAKYNIWMFILLLVMLLLILLICLGCICWICRNRRNGYNMFGRKKSSGILNAVLSIYCGLKDKESKEQPTSKSYGKSDPSNRSQAYPEPQKSYQTSETSTEYTSSEDESKSSST